MNEAKRRRRDMVQNLIITALSVSAVLLFTQTQLYSLAADAGRNYFQLFSSTETSGAAQQQGPGLSAPVHIAVTGDFGRYASVDLTTADARFSPLSSILGQALNDTSEYTPCEKTVFLQALEQFSVYCDFLFPLPLSYLGELIGVPISDTTTVRRVAVASQDNNVALYLWTGDDICLYRTTTLSRMTLEQTVDSFELGNAEFAFEQAETNENAAALAPYSLFPETEPVLPVLSGQLPSYDSDTLLATLKFNPNTNFRYAESSGTEVIMEGGRTLRLYTNGTVSYRSGGENTLSIKTSGEEPSLQEAIIGANTLLHTLVSSSMGDTSLYLQNVRQTGSSVTLTFGYQTAGIPIYFSDGGNAAEIVLVGNTVSALDLRIRQYTVSDETSLLLPLRQAMAIAASHKGAELFIGYADTGRNTVSAGWMTD